MQARRTVRAGLIRAGAICLMAVLIALPARASTGYAELGEHQALMVSLRINAQPADNAVLVVRDRSGEWLLPIDVLREAGVQFAHTAPEKIEGREYVRVAALGGGDIAFDEAKLALDIRLDPSRFAGTQLQTRPRRHHGPVSASAGAFLNYDLLLDQTPAGRGMTLFAEAAAAIGQGVGVSHHLFSDRPGIRDSIRLETTYTMDDPRQMASLRVGDAVTRPASASVRPVRFAGLQWGTNFQTQPGLVTMPVATLSGQAALPSTIDVYVDNVLQSRSPVPPGPFSVTSAPVISGEGEVLVKLTDLAGQETLISQRIYTSTVMLAAGLSDYSLSVGALRQNFGLRSNDYGDPFIAAGWRHGLSDRWTLELGGNVQKDGPVSAQAGLATALPGLGIVTASVGASDSPDGQGAQGALGFERRTRASTFSLRSHVASHEFRQMGVEASQVLRRLDSAFFGYRINDIGSIGFSHTRQQRIGGEPVTIATASFSTRQTAWGSLILSLSQTRTDRTDHQLSLFWVRGLGRDTSASAFHAKAGTQDAQQAVQLQKTMAPGEGWGYRLQAAHNAAQQAAVFGQNSIGVGRLELAELNGETSARAGFSGGIALLDGRWFASRRIDGSFGVVSLPGFPNVRVYVDNQLAARTNAEGYALLPRLYPFMHNNVSLEQLDLPIDARVDALKVQPVPAWRSGVKISFPVTQVAAATLELVRADGSAVPAGATVTLDGVQESFIVGHHGLLYVSGLQADNQLAVQWPTGACTVRIPYAHTRGQIPFLGQFACEPIRSRQ